SAPTPTPTPTPASPPTPLPSRPSPLPTPKTRSKYKPRTRLSLQKTAISNNAALHSSATNAAHLSTSYLTLNAAKKEVSKTNLATDPSGNLLWFSSPPAHLLRRPEAVHSLKFLAHLKAKGEPVPWKVS
ncbi:hypothetical protein HMI56_004706, partial [Coelomomyces lativittatus]